MKHGVVNLHLYTILCSPVRSLLLLFHNGTFHLERKITTGEEKLVARVFRSILDPPRWWRKSDLRLTCWHWTAWIKISGTVFFSSARRIIPSGKRTWQAESRGSTTWRPSCCPVSRSASPHWRGKWSWLKMWRLSEEQRPGTTLRWTSSTVGTPTRGFLSWVCPAISLGIR